MSEGKPRSSRTTIPISLDDLRSLVHVASDKQEKTSACDDGNKDECDDQRENRSALNDQKKKREDTARGLPAVEDFAASGGSISEALLHLDDDKPRVSRPTPSSLSPLTSASWHDSQPTVVDRAKTVGRDCAAEPAPESLWDIPVSDAKRTQDLEASSDGASARAPGSRQSSAENRRLLERALRLEQDGVPDGALELCNRVLAQTPENADAIALFGRLRRAALEGSETKIGDMDSVPVVNVSPRDVLKQKLDHQAGFVLSQVDGMLSYNDLLLVSGMTKFDTLRVLVQLLELGLIASRPTRHS